MNKKHIATLIAFLSLTSGLSLRSQTILNGRVDEIRAKIEAYDKEKASPTKKDCPKTQKTIHKGKIQKTPPHIRQYRHSRLHDPAR